MSGSNEGFQMINGVKTDIYLHWEVLLEDDQELIDEIYELPEDEKWSRIKLEVKNYCIKHNLKNMLKKIELMEGEGNENQLLD